MVYVLDKDKKPLMPCTNVIARLLLKQGKAKVIRRCPFTIKLNIKNAGIVKELTLGNDSGSGTLGCSVADNYGNIYYQSEVQVRNDIKSKMDERRSFRRIRRNCKTRYRKPRFNNRKNSKRKDRLSPTMTSKLNSHIKEIEFVKKILPISKTVIETGTFDVAALKDPSLHAESKKHWAYQKGIQYGYENLKAAVRARDGYKCCKCGCGGNLEVHHIWFRSEGGPDIAENLVTVCHDCHAKIHSGEIPNFKFKRKDLSNLKYATQMNIIRSQLLKRYPEAIETFGYVTSANMNEFNIEKTHANDAAVIATCGKKPNFLNDTIFYKRCNAKGDYKKTSGKHSEIKLNTDKIDGIRKFDKVSYFGKTAFIKGRMSSGYAVLMDINGKTINFDDMLKGCKTPKLSNLKRISARNSWMIIEEPCIVSIA